MCDTLQEWDKTLFLFLNGIHGPYWDHFAGIFTSKAPWGVMYASILYVLCKNFHWKMALVTALAFVLVAVVSDQLASSVLRPLFARPRPSRDPAIMEIVHLIDGRRGGDFGFPSAHAANTAAQATFIAFLFRRCRLTLFFVAWTLATCYTRVYAGVHYPGDVLFGILAGIQGKTGKKPEGKGIPGVVQEGLMEELPRLIGFALGKAETGKMAAGQGISSRQGGGLFVTSTGGGVLSRIFRQLP
jgi:undecaprenyl-diphosphatase